MPLSSRLCWTLTATVQARSPKISRWPTSLSSAVAVLFGPPVSEISTCSAKPFFAGSFSVKIQAGPITHADQVDEVWAVVVSPCHGIGGGDEAMEHIMSIGLTDGDQDGVFEATEDRFAWKGEYDISVYATDLEERLLASIQTDFLCEQGEFCSQCDVNGDGRSDLTDVSLILKTLAGNLPSGALPQGFPCPVPT